MLVLLRAEKTQPVPVLLLTLGHFFSDFYANFLPPLLPLLIANLGLSLTQSGELVLALAVAGSVLQPVFGYYADKSKATWLLLVSTAAAGLFLPAIGLASSFGGALIFITLGGLVSALYHPVSSSLVSAVAGARKGLVMAVFIGGGNLGFALAPVIVVYFLLRWGKLGLLALAVPGIVLAVLMFLLGLHAIPLPQGAPANTGNNGKPWYQSPDILLLNTVMGLRSWVQVAVSTYLPVLLAQAGYPPTLAANLLTAFLLGGAVGGLVGGYIADRFGEKFTIIAALASCLPPLYFFFQLTDISLLSWGLLLFSGAAMQATVPASIVLAQELLPDNRAMASGMMLGLAFGLGGLGVAVTGNLADHIGLLPALKWSLLPLGAAVGLGALIRPCYQRAR